MKRVVVVGSINVDMVVHVPNLPMAGETVIGGTFSISQGGKGANQAVAIARLEGNVELIAAIGKDELGNRAAEELLRDGVKPSSLIRKDLPTGVAQIMVDARGENMIAVASGANSVLSPEDIHSSLKSNLSRGDIVLANLEVSDDTVLAAAQEARKQGCRFILNPAPAHPLSPDLLSNCSILIPNEHEVAALGLENITDVFQYGVEAVVVTLGAQGTDLLQPGCAPYHLNSMPVEVKDTTGAGDAFNATFAWAISCEKSMIESLHLATAAGALATRKLGARAGMATRIELLDFLESLNQTAH